MPGLTVGRNRGQSLTLVIPGREPIVVVVERACGSHARIRVVAPQDCRIHRTELMAEAPAKQEVSP